MIHAHQSHPAPVLQPGIAVPQRRGNEVQPFEEGSPPALIEQPFGFQLQQMRGFVPVFGSAEQRKRVLRMTVCLQQFGGAPLQGLDPAGIDIGTQARLQEFAEQRVILKGRALDAATLGEQSATKEFVQQRSGILHLRQRLRHLHGELRKKRSAQQELARPRRDFLENLPGEVGKQRVAGAELPLVLDDATAMQGLDHKRDSRRPSVRMLLHAVDDRG